MNNKTGFSSITQASRNWERSPSLTCQNKSSASVALKLGLGILLKQKSRDWPVISKIWIFNKGETLTTTGSI